MSRRRASKPLSPLVLPIVAVVLTLVLAGIVLFFSLVTRERIVPMPGPTVTVSVEPTATPTASPEPMVTEPALEPQASVESDTVGNPQEPIPEVLQPEQGQAPVAPQQAPQAPAQQQPQPVPPAPVAPAPPVQPAPVPEQPAPQQPSIIDDVVKTGQDILCSLYCPL